MASSSTSEFLPSRPRVLFLVGETASGKHRAALALAREIGGEILSLDSMKVYRGMDIGTAKPSLEARREAPHHLLDLVAPPEAFSVARYVELAVAETARILERGKVPIFSGGTGLYLRALISGLFRGPSRNEEVRRALEAEFPTTELLFARLREVDSARAERILPGDRRRILRALEVHALGESPMSRQFAQEDSLRLREPYALFAIRREREDLERRIAERTLRLFEVGFVEEVRRLDASPNTRPGAQGSLAIGYPEVRRHIAGELSLDRTIEEVRIATRRFARKQRTWFRSFQELVPVPVSPEDRAEDVSRRIASAWGSSPRPSATGDRPEHPPDR